jgi:hypothetical protein
VIKTSAQEQKSNWKGVSSSLIRDAKEDVATRLVFTANTTAQRRKLVHERLQFYGRYTRVPPAYVAPPGIADPGIGTVMELNYGNSGMFFNFLEACNNIAWGPVAVRFSMCAQVPGGAWSTAFNVKY